MHDRLRTQPSKAETERTPTFVGLAEFPKETDPFRYAHYTARSGAVIDLTGQGMTGSVGREKDAFNLRDGVNAAEVGLVCTDYEGNQFTFGLFGEVDDLVCKHYRNKMTGRVTVEMLELEGFTDDLTSKPLTVGARHSRLSDLKLVGVLAMPQTGIIEPKVDSRSKGARNPLSIANDHYLAWLKSHPGR